MGHGAWGMGHGALGMGYGETKDKKDNFFLLPISNAQCPNLNHENCRFI
jgi:hypothetical protein